jgi:hypothetical protein
MIAASYSSGETPMIRAFALAGLVASVVFVLGEAASAAPMAPRPFVSSSPIQDVYYWHGHYYPYRYHGHYYRYHHNGQYYNHRSRHNGRWNYY